MGMESGTHKKNNRKGADTQMTDVSVGFINERVREEYEKAREENPQLFRFLERATSDLKENPFCGIKIPKNLWPKDYIKLFN